MEVTENGLVEVLKEPAVPVLPPGALRRLRLAQSKLAGAAEVAEAAMHAHRLALAQYEEMFKNFCEDFSIYVPPGPHEVAIDWATGMVSFNPKVR